MTDADNFGELALREHIRLIIMQDNVNEEEAKIRAWLEGPKGYVERKDARRKGGVQ